MLPLAMLALVPLLVPAATAAATGILCLLMLMVVDKWFRSWAADPSPQNRGLLGRLGGWVVGKVTSAVKWAERRLLSALSNAVAARSAVIVHLLWNLSEVVNRFSGTLADQAKQIHQALHVLRHVTLPAEIQAALKPVIQIANTALAFGEGAATTLTAVSIEFANGLAKLPWGAPIGLQARVAAFFNSYDHLWHQFFDITAPAVRTLTTTEIPRLWDAITSLAAQIPADVTAALGAITARLDALEARVFQALPSELQTLRDSVDALAALVIGTPGASLVELFARVAALEQQMQAFIGTEVAAFAARLTQLENEVRADIAVRLGQIEQTVAVLAAEIYGQIGAGLQMIVGRIEALEQQIATEIWPRIQAIEAQLQPAALAAVVLATMTQIAPYIFCRNTKATAERLCGLDENMIAQLLAGTLAFALVLDPRLIARLGQEFTGALDSVIKQTARI